MSDHEKAVGWEEQERKRLKRIYSVKRYGVNCRGGSILVVNGYVISFAGEKHGKTYENCHVVDPRSLEDYEKAAFEAGKQGDTEELDWDKDFGSGTIFDVDKAIRVNNFTNEKYRIS